MKAIWLGFRNSPRRSATERKFKYAKPSLLGQDFILILILVGNAGHRANTLGNLMATILGETS